MRWDKGKPGGMPGSWTNKLIFYDLLDDDDHCLGTVREDTRTDPPIFTAMTNYPVKTFPAMPTLKEAEAQLIHHFVVQRLDES